MKELRIIIIMLFMMDFTYGQIAIGKSSVDGDGLLDFGTEGKGIILPYTDVVSNPSPGTFVFSTNSKMVEYYDGKEWIEMNIEPNETAPVVTLSEVGEGVVLGSNSSTESGVLVLESTNKALILPKVADPHNTIGSPALGTMCYDTTSKSIAVFNGKEWSYWK